MKKKFLKRLFKKKTEISKVDTPVADSDKKSIDVTFAPYWDKDGNLHHRAYYEDGRPPRDY